MAPPEELGTIDIPVPRGLMYIESVRYTEPYSLQLIGGDDERLETFLAQRGIRSEEDIRDASRTDFFPKDRPIVTPYPPQVTNPSTGGYDVLYPCGQVPLGGIIMWSGALTDIDTECWHLCDGTPPTPDLRDRFIVGAGGSYAVGDTGGEDTSDLSHTHGVGTLANANESSHTHDIGTYAAANESSHTHADGTLATGNESAHTHADGTYAAANDTHNHGVSGTSGSESSHTHGDGTYNADASGTTVGMSSGADYWVRDGPHTHPVNGTSGTGSSHSHSDGTYAAENDTHSHDVTGTSAAGSAHNHSVSGSTAAGSAHTHSLSGTSAAGSAHTHTIAGNTDTGGLVAHDNRPQFYALAFIMRIA